MLAVCAAKKSRIVGWLMMGDDLGFLRRWASVPLKIYVISSRCGGGFGGLAECGMP